jgi:LPS O-antigen subunit length determinant protein (WzzB/FepE family)
VFNRDAHVRADVNSNQPIAIKRGDGIDFIAILEVMWRYRLLIGFVSIIFALLAVYIAMTAQEIFRAEVTVTEVRDNRLAVSGGLAGQLGGLASLAGLRGGSGGDPSLQGVLASRYLVEQFIKDQNLAPQLTSNSGKRATLWFAVRAFREQVLLIHDDQLKGLTTITMDWTDPATAANWANNFVALANDLIRTRVLEEATRNVAYLNKQIAQTKEVEIQRSLSDLIESETKTLMLANGRKDYAFRIVDPAVAPEVRHSPRRTLLVLSGTALGFFMGSVMSLGINAFRRSKFIQ